MNARDYEELLDDVVRAILRGSHSVAILGFTDVTLKLLSSLESIGELRAIHAIYVRRGSVLQVESSGVSILPFEKLESADFDVLIVAADRGKEELLMEAFPHIRGAPKAIVAGYSHFEFHDSIFDEVKSELLVPSLANGYPNTLVHIYQCLANSARLGLQGVIAEFGMFKGGTTMFLARLAKRFGQDWRVLGFDTFGGFPPRRSVLDMYEHPDCVFTDLASVRRYVEGENIEIVVGDVVETCRRLERENLVLSFIDTDNYTSAKAALKVVQERTVIGGAIVFDHFTGVDRFRYTLGERIAAKALLEDSRYFNLHSTGVFYRQR